MTIPSCLRLYQSKITDAGRGVWTNHGIPKNSLFGPYEGEKRKDGKEAERSGYSWMVSCQENKPKGGTGVPEQSLNLAWWGPGGLHFKIGNRF